jgi:hypothetical protein
MMKSADNWILKEDKEGAKMFRKCECGKQEIHVS